MPRRDFLHELEVNHVILEIPSFQGEVAEWLKALPC